MTGAIGVMWVHAGVTWMTGAIGVMWVNAGVLVNTVIGVDGDVYVIANGADDVIVLKNANVVKNPGGASVGSPLSQKKHLRPKTKTDHALWKTSQRTFHFVYRCR
jgi:uncharacterized membrane-anchored protein